MTLVRLFVNVAAAYSESESHLNPSSRTYYAMKTERIGNLKGGISREWDIYNGTLKNVKGVPSVHDYGEENDTRFIVLDMLGPSIFQECKRLARLSDKTISTIARDIVSLSLTRTFTSRTKT